MYLYGASGHAKVIIEILEKLGTKISGVFDDNESIQSILGYRVQKFQELIVQDGQLII